MTRLTDIEQRLDRVEAELRSGLRSGGVLAPAAPEPKSVLFDMPNCDCKQDRFVAADLADGRLIFSWQSLFRMDSEHNMRAANAKIAVLVQTMLGDGVFGDQVTVLDVAFAGYFTSEYRRQYNIGVQPGRAWAVTVKQTIESAGVA